MGRQARHDADALEQVKAEVLRLEREAGHLVRYIAGGDGSPTVHEQLHAAEDALRGLRATLAELDRGRGSAPPRAHRTWILAKLERLMAILLGDAPRAKAEIAKHLDGDLTIFPRPSEARQRRAGIIGRVKTKRPPGCPGGR